MKNLRKVFVQMEDFATSSRFYRVSFSFLSHFFKPSVAFLGLGILGNVYGADVSYQNEVQAVIAKAGCNLGTCHGNATGKGGFKMSLRGDDLDYDFAAMAEDISGRRINLMKPEDSLLLLKATQGVAHEGGKRFAKDSWEYKVLHDWIAQGANRKHNSDATLTKLEVTPKTDILVEPAKSIQIKAIATFSDGTTRDVSPYAVYEPAQIGLVNVSRDGFVQSLKPGEPTIIVRYLSKQQPVTISFVAARPEFAWVPTKQNNFVDREVFSKLKSLRMTPSKLAGDDVYVRRVFLDLLGLPPTTEEAQKFVADKSPDKRENLVNQLLARPEFADFWALKWADALRVEARTMDLKGMKAFHGWIRDAVAKNRPVNEFVHDILAAQGSTYKVPEANFYRAMREPNARAEAIAQVFLGTRLKCAQCHNHPFDKWTQDDYFNWAAVFARVDYKILDNKGTDKNDKHSFNGDQLVQLTKEVKFVNPRTGDKAKAKLLGAAELDGKTIASQGDLNAAADWVTDPQNALFAESQVNRIWFHLMGRGIVDPVDDFRATNPASHPKLLKRLAAEFVQSGYDMRHMIRLITNSRTYQLSSEPNENNADDAENYSHTIVRRLSAEQLFDSMHQFAGVRGFFTEFPEITRANQLPGPVTGSKITKYISPGIAFLRQFGQPPRLLACECERSNETTMGQAFSLISSPQIDQLLKRKDNILSSLLKDPLSDEARIERLYWAALTRSPSPEERTKLASMLTVASDKRGAMEDIAWSLLNAKEFVLRK